MTSPSQDSATRRRRREENAVRAGPGVLICPRCGVPLKGSDHDLGIAWRCEPCGGQSLNFSQFRRMVPEHGANDIWMQAISRPGAPQQRTQCPECLAGMDAVLIPFRGRFIELDICRACQRLWLDRQEIESSGGALTIIPGTVGRPALPGPPPSPKTSRAGVDHLLNILEREGDRLNERSRKKQMMVCSIWGLVAGLVAYALADYGRVEVAGVVAVIVFYCARFLSR